jgi:hypothetical protein
VRSKLDGLLRLHQQAKQEHADLELQVDTLKEALDLAPQVTQVLEELGQNLFGDLLDRIQDNLSLALQEVFPDHKIALKSERSFKWGGLFVSFYIDRDGKEENVLGGQGGSVLNVLSVGLRMFALATQDEAVHRRFLVLDEQDCWLRSDLVPRLTKIIALAAKELGLQVLVISHHDLDLFRDHVDRAYQFFPGSEHVTVREVALKSPVAVGAAGAITDPSPEDAGMGAAASPALAELLSAPGAQRADPIPVPNLEDHGIALARLHSPASVVRVLGPAPLVFAEPSSPGGELFLDKDGALYLDQAHQRGSVSCQVDDHGTLLVLKGGSERALTYELVFPDAEVQPFGAAKNGLGSLELAGAAWRYDGESEPRSWVEALTPQALCQVESLAVVAAQQQLETLRLLATQAAFSEAVEWQATLTTSLRQRDSFEGAVSVLDAQGQGHRLRRTLARLDTWASNANLPCVATAADGLRRARAGQQGGWWVK